MGTQSFERYGWDPNFLEAVVDRSRTLEGRRIAILLTDGFEEIEMTAPRDALDRSGAETFLISPVAPEIQGMQHNHPTHRFAVDIPLDAARAEDFDGILLPGGVASPDSLRTLQPAVDFVSEFFRAHKPVAAICHGPWMVIEAGGARGRTMTSWPSLRTDISNAGGRWVDEEVVEDRGLVTSRKPEDLAAFNRRMIEVFAENRQLALNPLAH